MVLGPAQIMQLGLVGSLGLLIPSSSWWGDSSCVCMLSHSCRIVGLLLGFAGCDQEGLSSDSHIFGLCYLMSASGQAGSSGYFFGLACEGSVVTVDLCRIVKVPRSWVYPAHWLAGKARRREFLFWCSSVLFFASGKHRLTNFSSQADNASSSKYQKSFVRNLSMPREVRANIHHNTALLASPKKLQGGETTVLDDGSAWPASSCGQIAGTSDVSHPRLQRMEASAFPLKKNGHMNICASSKQEPQTSAQTDNCRNKTGLLSDANLGRGLSNFSDEQNGFACSTSSCYPVVGGSAAFNVKLEGKKISACPGSVGFNNTSKGNKDDEVKGEIQSLVKLNLKLLCKNKRLGVDAFKEIARLSTHTILASCGFEHRKIVSPAPTLVCHHGDQTPQFHRSTIVPSSCRECFYVFVKDVVNSIMSKKLNSSKVTAKVAA